MSEIVILILIFIATVFLILIARVFGQLSSKYEKKHLESLEKKFVSNNQILSNQVESNWE